MADRPCQRETLRHRAGVKSGSWRDVVRTHPVAPSSREVTNDETARIGWRVAVCQGAGSTVWLLYCAYTVAPSALAARTWPARALTSSTLRSRYATS